MFKQMFYRRFIGVILISLMIPVLYMLAAGNHQLAVYDIPNFDEIMPFVDSNKYTHKKSEVIAINQQDLFTDPLMISTDYGTVYLDQASLAFQVVNHNGYIWSSTISDDIEGLPNTFKNRAKSALIIESFNTNVASFTLTEENLFQDNTEIIITLIQNGFHAEITFGRSGIKLGLYVTFGTDTITVSIPQDEIDESGFYKISSVKVYPYFGAILEDRVPGYVFLPDGIGALVDYKVTDPLISANYQKEIYDRHIGYNLTENMNTFLSGGTKIYAPVFGFVHGVNQNAVFAHITSGAEYAMINLYFPARTRGFTTVFSEFVYRRTYRQPIDKVGNTISLLQGFANEIDIEIIYTLLENEHANYVGMAKNYRDQLDLTPYEVTQASIPIRLDAIGLEKKQGLLWPETVVMTTINDFHNIALDLNEAGIDHIIGNYMGYTRQGVTWSAPNYQKISRKLGNKDDLEALRDTLNQLFFTTEYIQASNQSSGYNQYFDLAKKIHDQLYMYQSKTDTKYLLEHHVVKNIMQDSINTLSELPIDGFAIESMGSLLYSDFSNESYLKENILLYQSLLQEVEKKIALYDVNAYLWQETDLYFDFPMYASQYITFDDTVPFMSIVLSGSVPLFGPYANFYPYARDELLRLIDFGVYPSFVVTKKSSQAFEDTALELIYASRYQDIKGSIITYYDFVNAALSHVMGAKIIDREVIITGVVKITYDNDVEIYVNYLEQSYQSGDITIGPKHYVVNHINDGL